MAEREVFPMKKLNLRTKAKNTKGTGETSNLSPRCKPSRLKETTKFYLHLLAIWTIFCVPGNVVTLIMYLKSGDTRGIESDTNLDEFNATVRAFEKNRHVLLEEFCQDSVDDTHVAINEHDELTGAFLNCTLDLNSTSHLHHHSLLRESCDVIEALCLSNYTHLNPIIDCINQKQHEMEARHFKCYESLVDFGPIRARVKFWLEGIGILCVGIFGLFANILTCIILKDMKSNTSFNKLLMSLSIVDCLLIVDMIVEKSVIGVFLGEEPLWYKLTFPYIWYPFKGMILSATIFMLVAVSTERHRAVCHPMAKRQPPYKFIVFVVVASVTLDIPRFFHFKLEEDQKDYWTTDLHENPSYIQFISYWDELTVTGFAPLIALMYFNIKIYLKIRASANLQYRFVGGLTRNTLKQSGPNRDSLAVSGIGTSEGLETDVSDVRSCRSETLKINISLEKNRSHSSLKNTVKKQWSGKSISLGLPIGRRELQAEATSGNGTNQLGDNSPDEEISDWPTSLETEQQEFLRANKPNKRVVIPSKRLPFRSTNASGDCAEMRRRREKSTIILVTIVLLFCCCHSYRLALKVYEFLNPNRHVMTSFNHCFQLGKHHVPVASYVLHNIHYLFLVANSSVNFVVYCCVGQEFKSRMLKILRMK